MVPHRPVLLAVAAGCLVAAWVWARSGRRLARAWRRLRLQEGSGVGAESIDLARTAFIKDLHNAVLYLVLAASFVVAGLVGKVMLAIPFVLVLLPVGVSARYARRFITSARMSEQRAGLERRAEEVLAQEELAPLRWAERLAPDVLPELDGYEVGRVYEPGTGAMAGDFYDVHRTVASRLAVLIGDVTGHGIDASITAFQVKYLLRVFLTRYRDPAQAFEELNEILSSEVKSEEMVSICAVVVDEAAGTLRYASAGHPPAWLWHAGEVRPLRSTGPLLVLDPHATYTSREVALEPGDVLLLYTDGLAEARNGDALFGEERVAQMLRRDVGQHMDSLVKSLLEAARDFASGPLADDVAILAIRRL